MKSEEQIRNELENETELRDKFIERGEMDDATACISRIGLLRWVLGEENG